MITILAETSFKDKNGIYRKFNIQFLSRPEGKMIFVNLDGYSNQDGFSIVNLVDRENIQLFRDHIELMFGIKSIDDIKFLIEYQENFYQVVGYDNNMLYTKTVDCILQYEEYLQ